MKSKFWTIVTALIVASVLLISCQPQTVTVTVEVPVKETVEVEVVVEKTVEVPVEVEVEVPVGAELVTIKGRCRAKPPMEDWRCNNILMAIPEVNASLVAAGDDLRVLVDTVQDNMCSVDRVLV